VRRTHLITHEADSRLGGEDVGARLDSAITYKIFQLRWHSQRFKILDGFNAVVRMLIKQEKPGTSVSGDDKGVQLYLRRECESERLALDDQ
jgi:hypothetical protein